MKNLCDAIWLRAKYQQRCVDMSRPIDAPGSRYLFGKGYLIGEGEPIPLNWLGTSYVTPSKYEV